MSHRYRPRTYVGKSIRECRIKAGLSQREVARRVGLSAAYICDIEQGFREPPQNTLKRIAAVLGAEILMRPFTCSACDGSGIENLPRLWRN